MADDDVSVRFGASIEGLVAGVRQVEGEIQGLTAPIREVQEALGGMGDALVGAFLVDQIKEFVQSMSELGEATARTAAIFGISTEQVGELKSVAALTGVGFEQFTASMTRFEHGLIAGQKETSIQAEALAALGLSAKELIALPLPEQLNLVADAFSRSADGVAKADVASALFGTRMGTVMIPFLDRGRAGMEELGNVAHQTGDVLNEDMAQRFEEVHQHLETFGMAMEGLGIRVFNALQPMISSVVQWGTSLVESMNADTISAAAITIANTIASVIKNVGDLIIALTGDVSQFTADLQSGAREAGAAKDLFFGFDSSLSAGDALKQKWSDLAVMFGPQGQLQVNIKSTKDQLADFNKLVADSVASIDRGLSGQANQSGSPDDRNKPGSSKPQLATLAPLGSAGGGANSANSDVSVLKANQALTKQILGDELADHQITMAQWAQQTLVAVNSEYDAEVAGLNKELALGNLKVAQRAEILNKLKVLEDQHAQQLETINQKVHDDSVKWWNSALDPISSALNSQVSSVLKGTETIGQALQNIAMDVATTAVESAIKSITAAAASTFANVFSNQSLFLGPGAVGPAAASEALVLSAAGSLSSLDVGTWGLPADSPIMAHKGETIIPAFESGQFRDAMSALAGGQGSGQSGGGTIHVNAVDPRSFINMLNDHGSDLAKAVAKVFNANPSLRPTY